MNAPSKLSVKTGGLRKPDAIFFDWDGTLIDSLPIIHAAYNHTLQTFGLKELTADEARLKIRKSAREVFPEIFGENATTAQEVFYNHIYAEHLNHLNPIDGVNDFLSHVSLRDIRMGIISNKRHDILQREVDALGWNKIFPLVVGAGIAARDKPSPDPLLYAASQIGLNAHDHEIWYVGDTETDMQAAVAAEFRPIFIEHGLGTREDCIRVEIAPVFVTNLGDFIKLVQKSDQRGRKNLL